MCNEQTFLQASIAATVVVAAFGIILGLLSGSFSITFDGVYSLADAGMTVLALWVSKLIAVSATGGALSGRMRDRFTMGFWHLEPIVLLLNGTLLMAIAVYALINALTSVLKGGASAPIRVRHCLRCRHRVRLCDDGGDRCAS